MADYDKLFADPDYSLSNEERMKEVLKWVSKNKYLDVLDVGCGRGYYMKFLAEKLKISISGLEPSHYLITHDLKGMAVVETDIMSYTKKHQALYCMDVLEHLHPNELEDNLKALAAIAPDALLGIANHSDVWDSIDVHLIQENAQWWHEKLEQYYKRVNNLLNSERYFIFEAST